MKAAFQNTLKAAEARQLELNRAPYLDSRMHNSKAHGTTPQDSATTTAATPSLPVAADASHGAMYPTILAAMYPTTLLLLDRFFSATLSYSNGDCSSHGVSFRKVAVAG